MQICYLFVASICFTALFGDKLLTIFSSKDVRCVIDNTTHGLIGLFSWAAIVGYLRSKNFSLFGNRIYDILLCGFIASFIDIDHFIAAKSFSIKAATSLVKRPFLHCTSGWLVAWSLVFFANSVLKADWLLVLNWISIAAVMSHHIRDATRRGLWLWPAGSTPPIPYYIYITILGALPHLIGIAINLQTKKPSASVRIV